MKRIICLLLAMLLGVVVCGTAAVAQEEPTDTPASVEGEEVFIPEIECITPSEAPCEGTNNSENILGSDDATHGTELIRARDGDDSVLARGGNNEVYAGSGADYVLGGPVNDTLVGGGGPDHLEDSSSNDPDTLKGEGGDDQLSAADNDSLDKIFCGEGRDIAYADSGDSVSEDCESVNPPEDEISIAKGHQTRPYYCGHSYRYWRTIWRVPWGYINQYIYYDGYSGTGFNHWHWVEVWNWDRDPGRWMSVYADWWQRCSGVHQY